MKQGEGPDVAAGRGRPEGQFVLTALPGERFSEEQPQRRVRSFAHRERLPEVADRFLIASKGEAHSAPQKQCFCEGRAFAEGTVDLALRGRVVSSLEIDIGEIGESVQIVLTHRQHALKESSGGLRVAARRHEIGAGEKECRVIRPARQSLVQARSGFGDVAEFDEKLRL